MLTLAQLATPLTRDQVLDALFAAARGIGQVSQAGAVGAPPAGTGSLVVSGVPQGASYTVVVKITSGGQTSGLQIQYSLDGGATWSAAQSASGTSPWALALNGYPAYAQPSLVTGLTAMFSDGYPPIGGSWVAAETYIAQVTPSTLPVDDWEEGGLARTLLEVDAQVDADLSALIADVTAGGLVQYAQLGWLDLLAENVYVLSRNVALQTLGSVELVCAAAAGPYTIVPGQLWFQATSGNLYTNVDGATLPSGGTIILRVAAKQPGAANNDAVGTIALLSTPLPGVTVSNPAGWNLGALAWVANSYYVPGSSGDIRGLLVAPGNGFIYLLVSAAGYSGGAAPAWPTQIGQTVVDNQVTWQCLQVDESAQSYYQATSAKASGVISPNAKTGLIAATVVVWVTTGGTANTASFAISTNGGKTFGNPQGVNAGTLTVYAGASGSPNLNGDLVLSVTGLAANAFIAGDTYFFDTDWAYQYGTDAETDAALRLRCQQQWATLAVGAPAAQIEAWAKAASPEVAMAAASADTAADGSIDLYVAGAGVGVSGAAIAAVAAYVSARLPLGTSINGSVPKTATAFDITVSGTVYVAAASLAAAQQAIAAALNALALAAGIGGTIYYSQLMQAIQDAPGVRNVDYLGLSWSNGDFLLGAGYFAVLSTAILTFTAI